MKDHRNYVRLDVGLPLNPKVAALPPAASWAYVVSLCYCGQNLTDGVFPVDLVMRLSNAGPESDAAADLNYAGLWHQHEHECPDCPQARRGQAVVHHYLNHQRSADDARAAREAGKTGAAARWHANGNADGMPSGMRVVSEPHTKPHTKPHANPNAKEEGELELEKNKNSGRAKRATTVPDDFVITEPMKAWATGKGYGSQQVENQTERFLNYFQGEQTKHRDWVATWRNWLLRERPQRDVPADRETFVEGW